MLSQPEFLYLLLLFGAVLAISDPLWVTHIFGNGADTISSLLAVLDALCLVSFFMKCCLLLVLVILFWD